jgi:hypothetical protein
VPRHASQLPTVVDIKLCYSTDRWTLFLSCEMNITSLLVATTNLLFWNLEQISLKMRRVCQLSNHREWRRTRCAQTRVESFRISRRDVRLRNREQRGRRAPVRPSSPPFCVLARRGLGTCEILVIYIRHTKYNQICVYYPCCSVYHGRGSRHLSPFSAADSIRSSTAGGRCSNLRPAV